MEGAERRKAVREAADGLLVEYRTRWPTMAPVELHRLASTLKARIKTVRALQGGASLLPVSDGFVVLVSDELEPSKFRTSVAHELAHTLFYCQDGPTPSRLAKPTREEEFFCFDVARLLLAPEWIVADLGFSDISDPDLLFRSFLDRLALCKPYAARLMLDDYQLATGVAGRWNLTGGIWALQSGGACASQTLTERQRKVLWAKAKAWLLHRVQPMTNHCVLGSEDVPGRSAFVVVAEKPKGKAVQVAIQRDAVNTITCDHVDLVLGSKQLVQGELF